LQEAFSYYLPKNNYVLNLFLRCHADADVIATLWKTNDSYNIPIVLNHCIGFLNPIFEHSIE